MKISVSKAVAVAAVSLSAMGVHAADQVLTFEDISLITSSAAHTVFAGPPAIAVFNNPTTYQGFNFGTLGSASNPWYAGEVGVCATCVFTPTEYGASSGTKVVAVDNQFNPPGADTDFDQSPAITSATPFRFIGASFTGGIANGTSGNKVKYELLDQFGATIAVTGDLTFAASPVPLPNGMLTNVPVFLNNPLSAQLVYGVKIQSQWALYAMDDFTYNTSPVPEPGTYALLLAGLGVVVAIARKRRV